MALNTMAYLARESDLISIRPKDPVGTKLIMTTTQKGVVVVAGISLPLVLLIFSGVFWYRRRNA